MLQVSRLLEIARAIDEQRVNSCAARLSPRLRPETQAFAIAVLLTAAYPALGVVIEANPDIAERLAAEGAAVVVAARREDRLASLVERIEGNGGRALAVSCDITDESQAHALFQRTEEGFGRTYS